MKYQFFCNFQEEKPHVRSYPEQFKHKNEASNCEICWNYISEEMK